MDPLEVIMRGGMGVVVVIIGLFLLVGIIMDIAGFSTYLQADGFGSVWVFFAMSLMVVFMGMYLAGTLVHEYYLKRRRASMYEK